MKCCIQWYLELLQSDMRIKIAWNMYEVLLTMVLKITTEWCEDQHCIHKFSNTGTLLYCRKLQEHVSQLQPTGCMTNLGKMNIHFDVYITKKKNVSFSCKLLNCFSWIRVLPASFIVDLPTNIQKYWAIFVNLICYLGYIFH